MDMAMAMMNASLEIGEHATEQMEQGRVDRSGAWLFSDAGLMPHTGGGGGLEIRSLNLPETEPCGPDRDDGYSGQILQATPNLHVHGEGGRFSADVNYQPIVSVGNSDTDPELLTHDLLGRARLEAVEDKFFIGADTSARLTGNSSSSASVDAVNFNSEGGQQVFTFGLTPEYRHHINKYADFTSNNRFDWVTYSGNNGRQQ